MHYMRVQPSNINKKSSIKSDQEAHSRTITELLTPHLSYMLLQHLGSFSVAVHLQVLIDEEEQSVVFLRGHSAPQGPAHKPTEPHTSRGHRDEGEQRHRGGILLTSY